jgi:spoIIIJ-associated protein
MSKPTTQTAVVEAPTDDRVLKVAAQVVLELLEKMKVRARVESKFEFSEEDNERVVMVEILGDDLSILIGKRSETLNALQYISGLIVGKEMGEWVPLTIDVQGYRARRERQLRQIARRMAEQAVHTGRRQVLEPMPANERRIIHLELHDHPQVNTESVGDEPNRKVTIVAKRGPTQKSSNS